MPTKKSKADKSFPSDGLGKVLKHLDYLDPQGLGSVGEKISRERELTYGIIKNLKEAVIVVDRWGIIEMINPAAIGMLGLEGTYNKRESQKIPSLWRAAPELAGIFKVGSDGALGELKNLSMELQLHYPTSTIVRMRATPLEGLERLLIVMGDCTGEKAALNRDLEDARMGALTQLAAGVAHELGNPLNALEIHLQLLERGLAAEKLSPKAEKLSKSLRTAQGELKRLDSIIRNFLQAIRPQPPVLVPTDLVAVLEEVLTVLRVEFENARIAIRVEVPGMLPTVLADVEQVKQVYFNLLKNAREAMEAGGTLRVVAVVEDSFLSLNFIDSGKGIADEQLTHLFEPYHTSKKGGSGLGLMIAQKIMRAHGGSIEVESKPSHGTTVRLKFPTQSMSRISLPYRAPKQIE